MIFALRPRSTYFRLFEALSIHLESFLKNPKPMGYLKEGAKNDMGDYGLRGGSGFGGLGFRV